MKCERTADGDFILRFKYDPDLVRQIKTLDGRSWDMAYQQWNVLGSKTNETKLKRFGFKIPGRKIKQAAKKIDIEALNLPLYDFQKEGVQLIESFNGRVLLADDMGLGKTIQTLGYAKAHPEIKKVVVVCLASIKINWAREIKLWGAGSSVILSGKTPSAPINNNARFVIINYEILKDWLPRLKDWGPELVIIDECHFIKSSKAQRTKATKALCVGIDKIIPMSGTPVQNRPIEFFTVINMLAPKEFPSFWNFAQRYCGAKHNGFGWDFNGASNIEELHKRLTDTVMIRRRKKDVLKDLPKKTRAIIPLEINQRDYKIEMKALAKWLNENNDSALAMVEIEKTKQVIVRSKLKAAINWIEDFLNGRHKLVVFAIHHEFIDALKNHFGDRAVVVDGRVSSRERKDGSSDRQEAVDRFQTNDTVELFIGQIKAAGVGLNLTRAWATAFLEFEWSPGLHDQAEDRVHRIGQESDKVLAYYLVAVDTIEEELAATIDEKAKVLTGLLDGTKVSAGTVLSKLIDRIKNNK